MCVCGDGGGAVRVERAVLTETGVDMLPLTDC